MCRKIGPRIQAKQNKQVIDSKLELGYHIPVFLETLDNNKSGKYRIIDEITKHTLILHVTIKQFRKNAKC
jgi:hypothetical protein